MTGRVSLYWYILPGDFLGDDIVSSHFTDVRFSTTPSFSYRRMHKDLNDTVVLRELQYRFRGLYTFVRVSVTFFI